MIVWKTMFLYSLQYFDNEITTIFRIKVLKIKSIYLEQCISKKERLHYNYNGRFLFTNFNNNLIIIVLNLIIIIILIFTEMYLHALYI